MIDLKTLLPDPWKYASAGLAAALVVAAGVGVVQSSRLDLAQVKLKAQVAEIDRQKAKVIQGNLDLISERAARQKEREQCAQDFAGEVMRAKAEAEKAAKAATAVATLTKNCVFDQGQPAVNRALKDVLGEQTK